MTDADRATLIQSILSDMSIYEAIDLQLQRWAMAQHTEEMIVVTTTIYLTVVSAFLGAAYVGGAKLTRPQAIIGSSVFTAAALFNAQQVYAFFQEFDGQLRTIGQQYIQMAEVYEKPAWAAYGVSIQAGAAGDWHEYILLGLISWNGTYMESRI